MKWSFDPGVIAWLLFAETLYLRALHTLRNRDFRVPRAQIFFWHFGLFLWIVGLISPIGAWGERFLWAHMAEHLLIADIAAPFLLVGIRTPVLVFLLPASTLKILARYHRLRRISREMRRPQFAIPIYILVLYGWHLSFAFEAAAKHPVIHAAQHASFITIGVLVWWSAMEPKKRRLDGQLWKIGHLFAARMLGMFLGMGFVIIRQPIYTGIYARGYRGWGLDALGDQQLAGAEMVVLDIFIMMFALAFFFYRAAQDHDREEQGIEPEQEDLEITVRAKKPRVPA